MSLCGVALQLRRWGAPYTLNYARLASGAFYGTIGLLTFWVIITVE
jgi:hypothetical protein